ncbi:hypothetical protein AMECASPLE_037151 [Ameca splendens]|uniref:Uncharacterized protein n=1 Tax=Ameca splendens TaxID=208324 RepID=A0ABV1A467_9TELE
MSQKSYANNLEALETILQGSALEVEDSLDSRVDFEVDEDERLLSDLVHYQEEAGPSGTERTQPPTTLFETLSLSSGDCAENEEHEEYEPPACQLKVMTARTSGTLQVSLPLGHKL